MLYLCLIASFLNGSSTEAFDEIDEEVLEEQVIVLEDDVQEETLFLEEELED